MSQPFIGEIRLFAGNFAPVGWSFCDGQIIAISENSTLFNLIGTTYGGDGQQTFALPDLRSRVPLHQGQGSGLSAYQIGQNGGVENVTLAVGQLPAHSHGLKASLHEALSTATEADYLGSTTQSQHYGSGTPDVPMDPDTLTSVGGNQPHLNLAPFTALNYIIALYGVYPSQN